MYYLTRLDPQKKDIITGKGKYRIKTEKDYSELTIGRVNITDSGIYILEVNNGVFKRSINITLLVHGRYPLFCINLCHLTCLFIYIVKIANFKYCVFFTTLEGVTSHS